MDTPEDRMFDIVVDALEAHRPRLVEQGKNALRDLIGNELDEIRDAFERRLDDERGKLIEQALTVLVDDLSPLLLTKPRSALDDLRDRLRGNGGDHAAA